jgi:hypothetical protein
MGRVACDPSSLKSCRGATVERPLASTNHVSRQNVRSLRHETTATAGSDGDRADDSNACPWLGVEAGERTFRLQPMQWRHEGKDWLVYDVE